MERSVDVTELVALRRELHSHAELAGQEEQTSRIIRDFIGLFEPCALVTELCGTGVAAVFEGSDEGPTVMSRTELDSVPVEEKIHLIRSLGAEVWAVTLSEEGMTLEEAQKARSGLTAKRGIPVMLPLRDELGDLVEIIKIKIEPGRVF